MSSSLSWSGFGSLAAEDVWPAMAMVWVFSAAGIAPVAHVRRRMPTTSRPGSASAAGLTRL